MENIAAFLRAAEVIGVPHHELFETVDLYDASDPVQVVITLRSLSRHAHLKNPSVDVLGPKLQSPDLHPKKREFKPTGIPAWNTRQYGSMEGASQGTEGVIFGGTRSIVLPQSKPVARPPPNIIVGGSSQRVHNDVANTADTLTILTPDTKTPPKPGPKPIGLSFKSSGVSIRTGAAPRGPRPFASNTTTTTRSSVFGEGGDEDEDTHSSFPGKKKKSRLLDDRKRINAQLIAQGMNSQQLADKSSESLDPSTYAYDDVYDTMKAAESQAKVSVKSDDGDRKVSRAQPTYLSLRLGRVEQK